MILSCGEALIDMLPRTLPDGGGTFLPVAGGAVFNTAITLGRLGADAGFLSGISTDMFGTILRDTLRQSNVDDSLCILSPRPTTLAFVKLTDGHAEYVFYDENSAGRMIEKSQLPEIPAKVSAMHFGAISLIPDPCGDAYEALALRESSRSVISLDPNIRPGFITDADHHRARINRMIAISDIIKVSDEDLEWLHAGVEAEEIAGRWLGEATSVVVLTRGSRGATLFTRAGRMDVAAAKATVADTVGAGDSFNGGFLHGLERSGMLSREALQKAGPEDLRPAAELAAAVAAVTVSRAGANPPWARELDHPLAG